MSPFSGFLAQGGSRLLSLTNVYSNNKMPEAKNLSTAWASVGDSLQTVWIIGIRRIKNLKSRLHVLKYSLEYLDFQKCRLTLGHHHHYFTSCKSHSCFFFSLISQSHVFRSWVHLCEQPTASAKMHPTWLGVWWRCRLCRCIRWTSELHTQILWHQRIHL